MINQIRHLVFEMRGGICTLTAFRTNDLSIVIDFSYYLSTYYTWDRFCIIDIQSTTYVIFYSINNNMKKMYIWKFLQILLNKFFVLHLPPLSNILYVLYHGWSWISCIWCCNRSSNYISSGSIFFTWKRTSRTPWLSSHSHKTT